MNLFLFVVLVIPCSLAAVFTLRAALTGHPTRSTRTWELIGGSIALFIALLAFFRQDLAISLYMSAVYFLCLGAALLFTAGPFLYRQKIEAEFLGAEERFRVRRKTRSVLRFRADPRRGANSGEEVGNCPEAVRGKPEGVMLLSDDTYTEKRIDKDFAVGQNYSVWIRPDRYDKCRINRYQDFPIGLAALVTLLLIPAGWLWSLLIS